MSGRPVNYTEKRRKQLEDRVAELEAQVADLLARVIILETP